MDGKLIFLTGIILMVMGVMFMERLTPLGYAEWVLYFIPFMLASRLMGRRSILLLAAFIVLLIAAGFFISPAGPPTVALTNRLFGILAILLMTSVILQRMRAEEQIKHLAHHDPLTGLPNRRLFMDLADLELARARRNDTAVGILYLDLDGFKEINDTHGHEAGDKLLMRVAARLRAQVRKSDAVARQGGDEFTVLLSEISTREGAEHTAGKILAAFQEPFVIDGRELRVTISIGISAYPADGGDSAALLRNADAALHRAKEEGKNTFRLYRQ